MTKSKKSFPNGLVNANPPATIEFEVLGTPFAKQSFRYTVNGGGYTNHKVKDWQRHVSNCSALAMLGKECFHGEVVVTMVFILPTHRRVDLDNLSKAVLDGMNKIVFDDDRQVISLHLHKAYDKDNPGVSICVKESWETLGDVL